jgi:hypothetical protein
MDPLSVASGVAGLVTLAEVVISRTYNTIITCKHASEDSRKLLREVQALAGILQSLAALESKIGPTAIRSQVTAHQVYDCQKTLQSIRDRLERADPKEQGISFVQKAKRTLKWPFSLSDTEEFLAEMERHKSSFDLALSVDALDAIIAFKTAEEETSNKLDQVNNAIEKLCKVQMTKEIRRLLQAVRADAADEMYRTNLELHQRGTGTWFLEEGSASTCGSAQLGQSCGCMPFLELARLFCPLWPSRRQRSQQVPHMEFSSTTTITVPIAHNVYPIF